MVAALPAVFFPKPATVEQIWWHWNYIASRGACPGLKTMPLKDTKDTGPQDWSEGVGAGEVVGRGCAPVAARTRGTGGSGERPGRGAGPGRLGLSLWP